MSRRYPEGMAVRAEPPEWVSQHDAARELGIAVVRVGGLVANGHLRAAETATREMGVTRASLDEEKRRRSDASPARKALRVLRDAVRWF